MSLSSVVRRVVPAAAALVAALALSACSGSSNYVDHSDYVSPIAVSSAPQPAVPSASGHASTGRRPLLPPVPGEQTSNGLPPVTVASLLPPPPAVR